MEQLSLLCSLMLEEPQSSSSFLTVRKMDLTIDLLTKKQPRQNVNVLLTRDRKTEKPKESRTVKKNLLKLQKLSMEVIQKHQKKKKLLTLRIR